MKPLCDLCGDRHEKHQAHLFRHVVNRHVVNVQEPETSVMADGPANPDRHKDKEARKKYMREYMRKKRAGLPR